MDASKLDPTTANVAFDYVCIGDPEGEYNVGREYYWYDPKPREPAIKDYDFRRQRPEYDDREWDRLRGEAFKRGRAEKDPQWQSLLGWAADVAAMATYVQQLRDGVGHAEARVAGETARRQVLRLRGEAPGG
jgi:hypothetical protein